MKIFTILMSASLALAACGGDDGNTTKDGSVPIDALVIDGAGSNVNPPADASCFDLTTITAPTNNQIINACTDAIPVFKDSHPPLLGSDGTLPPLGSGS